MGRLMAQEDLTHFENLIYLPMILTILHNDQKLIDIMPFKLKRPYQQLVGDAIKCVERDFRSSRIFIKKQTYKVLQGGRDELFTEYVFYYKGYEEHRKYLNYHLRNRTEELIHTYFEQGINENPLL